MFDQFSFYGFGQSGPWFEKVRHRPKTKNPAGFVGEQGSENR